MEGQEAFTLTLPEAVDPADWVTAHGVKGLRAFVVFGSSDSSRWRSRSCPLGQVPRGRTCPETTTQHFDSGPSERRQPVLTQASAGPVPARGGSRSRRSWARTRRVAGKTTGGCRNYWLSVRAQLSCWPRFSGRYRDVRSTPRLIKRVAPSVHITNHEEVIAGSKVDLKTRVPPSDHEPGASGAPLDYEAAVHYLGNYATTSKGVKGKVPPSSCTKQLLQMLRAHFRPRTISIVESNQSRVTPNCRNEDDAQPTAPKPKTSNLATLFYSQFGVGTKSAICLGSSAPNRPWITEI